MRSNDQPARAAASGSIESRAVMPAGPKAAARAANTASTSTLTASPPYPHATRGTPATAAPDSASATIDTRLRPK